MSEQVIKEPGNCVLCYLQEELDSAFVCEELMHIPEDTPEWVSNWK